MDKTKILIIDDEKDLLDLLKEKLELEGYEVVTASDGEEGLISAQVCEPDLIICDIKMPKKDGFEVLPYTIDSYCSRACAIWLPEYGPERHELVTDEGKAVLEVVGKYAKSWSLLLKYDEDRLELPKDRHPIKKSLQYGKAIEAILALKNELMERGEAGDLFGQERGQNLQGILGNIERTFDGQDLYPSVEEKAAHLLYFVIKDHPFSDGNKRIGSFLFLVFLRENNLLEQSGINANGLVALALLIAESDPKQKDLMIRLILNLLARKSEE